MIYNSIGAWDVNPAGGGSGVLVCCRPYVYATNDPLNKCLQQEMVEPQMGLCATVRALQFWQAAYVIGEIHTRNGGGNH
jgi:hypothetical protein